jgi:anti-sigma regulatory factor (Ser/Thr protein kinase)
VRAAAAEVEDYRRVEVLVNDHIDVAGRAVADLAHLLAELIENATTFSPPSSEVRIRSHLSPGESTRFVVTIEDIGIGMSAEDVAAANSVLAEAPQIDLRRATMLGFHVVARLAQRYDIQVRLAATPGGGLTALVSLPRELISDRPADAPPPPTTTTISAKDRYQRAAMAWSGGRRPAVAANAAPWAQRPWFESEIETPALPERAQPPLAPAWLDSVPMPDWLNAPGPPPEQAPPPAAPPAVPPAAPPAVPILAEPVMPGTRLGPVAEWIDVLRAPVEPAPATPPAPAPAEPATTTTATWWAALVVPAPAVEAERRTSWPPPRRSQPVDVHATPAPTQPSPLPPPAPPAGPVAAPGGDGLARRVPGTHLAPALRRDAGADGDADAATQGGSRDVERVRAMLSRFQSSQHAGRVAADPPPRRPPEENR